MFEFVVTCHELYLRPSVLGCVDSNRNLRRDVTVGWTHLELKACSLHWIYFSNDDAVEKHEVAITFPLRKILSLVLVPINI